MPDLTTPTTERLTVQYAGGDCGNFITGNTYDEFLLLRDGQELFRARFDYAINEHETAGRGSSFTLVQLTDVQAGELPLIVNELDLLARLNDTLLSLMCERGLEFFCDLFDEPGETVELLLASPFELLVAQMRAAGWRDVQGGVAHVEHGFVHPNWDAALACCIEVASDV